MNENRPPRLGTLAIIIAVAVGLRLLCRLLMPDFPNPMANFAPIGAMALFGGAYYGRGKMGWLSLLIPIVIVWVSDWFVNLHDLGSFTPFYSGFYWQYLAYGMMVLLGAELIKRVKPVAVIGTSLFGSIIFFLISNFGVWVSGTMVVYPMTFDGLILCYVAGIPYFGGTVLGDLFFCGVFFGAFELAKTKFPAVAAKSEVAHA